MSVWVWELVQLAKLPSAGMPFFLQTGGGSPQSYLQQLGEILTTFGLKILAAIAVLVIGNWLAKWTRNLLKRLMQAREIDATVTNFVANLTYYALLTLVVIVALGQLGVQVASFVAVIGAAGLAVGFAIQGSLSNFAAGVLLILFRFFKAGDYIEAGGTAGTVKAVEIFTTTLASPDNKEIIVPNSNILAGNIVNYSTNPTRRVDMVFSISYNDDIDKAKQIIWEVLNQDDRILGDPAPSVSLSELAESSVNFSVSVWVNNPDYWGVLCDTTETIKKRFDAVGIAIPYPQREVHIHSSQN